MVQDTRRLRVAAAQIPIGAQLEENLGRILATMRSCAEQGVELVAFPETALTGYSPTIGHGRSPEEWPQIEAGLAAIGRLAQELRLAVAVGSEAWEGDAWVNRYYAYDASGALVGFYDKVHLTNDDTRYYRPGKGATVIELAGVRVGLQICYDARFPEGYRALLHQGVEVIVQGFYGAGTGTWKVPVLAAHLRSRAAESGCFVVASNVSGPLQIVVSQIVDPLGLVLAQANQDCEEVISAELVLDRIAASEIRRDYLSRFSSPEAR
jgi:predicted amidohydrolase